MFMQEIPFEEDFIKIDFEMEDGFLYIATTSEIEENEDVDNRLFKLEDVRVRGDGVPINVSIKDLQPSVKAVVILSNDGVHAYCRRSNPCVIH